MHYPFVTDTQGIRVSVRPEFNERDSNPEASVYVYAYHIRITNLGKEAVQLVSRHWIIKDGFSRVEHVVGEGVIGQKPLLSPGESFEYSSFCPLHTPTGSMQGSFQMRGSSESTFEAMIGEFPLKHLSLVN